jgi:hypothetical protein
MDVFTRNKYLDERRVLFEHAGLNASAFSECSEEEVSLLVRLQAEVLGNSYHDFVSMIEFCTTAYIYAMEYKTRKTAFATYAANNESSAAIGGMTAATVMIYRNAMKFELKELCRYFYIYLATDADRARPTPGRLTPDPEEVFGRYYNGYSGCMSLVCVLFTAIGSLLALARSL